MSNAFSTDVSTVLGWFSTVGKKIEAWFSSSTGQAVTGTVATLAGQATAYELIEQAGANKSTVANYLASIGGVVETVFAGSTSPTAAQVQSALSSVKTDASTTSLLAPLILALSQDITAYCGTFDGGVSGISGNSPYFNVAKAYVTGLVAGSLAYAPTTT